MRISFKNSHVLREIYTESSGKSFFNRILYLLQYDLTVKFLPDAGHAAIQPSSGYHRGLEAGIVSNENGAMLQEGAGNAALGASDDFLFPD